MKKRKIGIVVLFIVLLMGGMVFFLFYSQAQDIQDLSYPFVNMQQVVDGEYEQSVDTALIKVKVKVTVENHHLKEILILKHDNGLGSAAETIVEDMIQNNDYQVDTVSGATYSSQVIKSAVSQALEKGMRKGE